MIPLPPSPPRYYPKIRSKLHPFTLTPGLPSFLSTISAVYRTVHGGRTALLGQPRRSRAPPIRFAQPAPRHRKRARLGLCVSSLHLRLYRVQLAGSVRRYVPHEPGQPQRSRFTSQSSLYRLRGCCYCFGLHGHVVSAEPTASIYLVASAADVIFLRLATHDLKAGAVLDCPELLSLCYSGMLNASW